MDLIERLTEIRKETIYGAGRRGRTTITEQGEVENDSPKSFVEPESIHKSSETVIFRGYTTSN
jgi:hypothetical protein